MLTLASAVAATGTVTQTAQATRTTPFMQGRKATVTCDLTTVTGTPTVLVETSGDGTSYTTAATFTVIGKVKKIDITLDNFVRVRQSVAGSAGTFDVYLDPPA